MGVVSRRWVWVESMCVASWCGCKEVYVYIDFLILFIPIPLVSALFAAIISYGSYNIYIYMVK